MGQLFSKKNKEVFSAPLGIDNPVTVQVLGNHSLTELVTVWVMPRFW